MNAPKWSQEITRRSPKPFYSIGMNFPHAVSVIISRPLVLAMADGSVRPLDLIVALPFIGVTGGRLLRVAMYVLVQCLAVGMLANSQTALSTSPANGSNYWWPVIVIAAVTSSLVCPTTRWIKRICVLFAFFPPRSGTSRRFPFLRHSVWLDSACQRHWPECACANDGHMGVRATTPVRARCRAHLCRYRVTIRQGVADRGCCQRIWFPYRDCRPSDRVDSDNRPIHVCECERDEPARSLPCSQGTSTRLGESMSSSIQCFLVRPASRLLGRSFQKSNTHQWVT
jgi:hypothetical protein